ncbi:unnamed protein product [Mytilus coruscus]|uniref:Nose resistant-to-fluoxetine protein N-terminal domain-containing protein n=1 Tax=Mytilus coruscus TaxID=42192 RepID=A0A6J8D373_MYTCO|nr:unnamed protein product [Mytilus coruscus]
MGSDLNVKRSPIEYGKLARTLSNITDLRTISSYHFSNLRNEVQEGNVTEVPPNERTSNSSSPTVSNRCLTDVSGVVQAVAQQKIWALKMIDAAGKPPANLLGGGFKWLGDYDECLHIQRSTAIENKEWTFGPEYCMLSVLNLQAVTNILPQYTTLSIGMCLPDSCSEQDTQNLIDSILRNYTNNTFIVNKAECQEPDKTFDTRAIIVLVTISLFVFVMVVGTVYDVTMIQLPKWEKTTRQSELHAETAFVESEKTPLIHHDVTDSYSKYKPGMFGELLLPFSVYTNGAKMLNTNQPEGSLTAINGIRFISMTWVILGHAYGFILSDVDNVGSFLPKMIKRATFPAISNALVSVDTFFVLSGTLLVYIVMKELKKNGGKLNWGMFYFHRFWSYPMIGYALLLAFLCGTWIATGIMATKWNVPMSSFDGGDMTHYYEIYFRPYFRMGPYLVGMFTGYLLYKTDLKLKMNRFLNLFGWLIATVSACAVLYGVYDDVNGSRESRDVSSFYITVHRTVWGAAVGWVIFACAHGYGGYVNTVLSWKGFIPLSRLTYCAYLVHPPVIYYYLSTRRRLIHLSDIEIIYEFLGHLGLSYAAAFLASLAFEAPMMGLEKVIFKSKEHKK